MADLIAPNQPYVAPGPTPLEQAVQQYPVLRNLGLTYKHSPGAGNGNKLEFWPPGEPGAANSPRPPEIPLHQPGVEVFDPSVTPLDILGDVTSHHLIENDPTVAQHYKNFSGSLTPDQNARLVEQYNWARQNGGETRPFEQWKESSGLPAYFRGYPFQQWPEDFNQQAYTPEQRQQLDGMMEYLRGQPKAQPQQFVPTPAQPATQLQSINATPAHFGYDPTASEIGSGMAVGAGANALNTDQKMIQPTPTIIDRGMERAPESIPKAPLQQVPEDQLLPNRPNFYQRQFEASAQPTTRLQHVSGLAASGDIALPEPQQRAYPTPPYYSGPGDEAFIKNKPLPPDRNTFDADQTMSYRSSDNKTEDI